MKRRPVLTRLPLALQLVLYECPILHGSMDHGVVSVKIVLEDTVSQTSTESK